MSHLCILLNCVGRLTIYLRISTSVCINQIDYPKLSKQEIHPMVIVSRISRQHCHQKYDRRIHMGKFPTNIQKKQILLPKTWDQFGLQFHSIKPQARPILLEKWMAYCNGKAPSQQAGNPLHSCENGRLVKTWRMGSPGLVSSYL